MKTIYKNIIGLVALTILYGQLSAQQTFINKEWDLANGIPGTHDQVACALDPFGNLVYITNTISGTNSDIFLNCIHPGGGVAWQQTCTSSPTTDDYGADLVIDGSGNIYVAAAHYNGSNYDYLVAKYTASGILVWQQLYDGPANGDDVPTAITLDASGNVYVTGSATTTTMTDYATIKYDNSGVQQWVQFYNFSNKVEVATDIAVDNSGNIIVCGASAQNWFNSDFALRKYSPAGAVLATKRHNTPGNGYDLPIQMVVDVSGNVYVIGTADAAGNKDIKLIAYDSNLNVQWVEYIDRSGNADEGYGLALDNSDNVIITGFCTKSSGGTEFIVAKYNSISGIKLWENIRSAPIDTDIAKGRQVTTDAAGNIYVAGEVELNGSRDYSLMSFDPGGAIRFVKDFNINQNDHVHQLLRSGDNIYLTGISDSSTTKQVTTVKVSVFDKDQPTVYCGTKPCAVDDEALVRFNPEDLILSNVDNPDKTWSFVSEFVNSTAIAAINEKVGFDIGRQKCYKVHPNLTSSDTVSISRLGNTVKLPPFYATFGVILPDKSNDTLVIQNLNSAVPHVLVSTFNHYAWLTLGANDPHFNNGNSAGLTPSTSIPNAHINIEGAWDYETGDSSIIVGTYDSGINYAHSDLSHGNFASSSVKGGYDYFNSAPITSTANPDDYGHGSAVAGIMAAWRNNSYGIAGVAGGPIGFEGVSVHDMKIFAANPTGCGLTATFSATAAQIQQAIIEGATGTGPIPNIQDIMNHSWGGPLNPLIREAFLTAYDAEIVSIVASGNGAPAINPCTIISFSSTFKDHLVMKVGANDSTGARATFSECGFGLDFIAPGTHDLYIGVDNSGSSFTDSIQHPNPSCPDGALNGTSFAAPHASGVTALMLGYYKKNVPTPDNILAPEDCEELMQRNTFDLTTPPNLPGYDDETGWGRLNAGELFDSIQYPKFLVKHYEFTTSTSSAILVGTNESACLEQSIAGLPAGELEFRINRWQVTASTTHTLPSGYNLITGWPRGSGSEDIAGINSAPGAVNCSPSTCFNCNYIPDAPNPSINTGSISPTGVTMTGYIYELLDTSGNTVGWWPADTNYIATFAYSLYLVNPTVGIEEESELTFNLYPNPSNNTVTIKLGTEMQGETEIVLTDMLGKQVKVIAKGQNMASGQIITFAVDELSQGMYFVSLRNGEKQLSRKLLVNK